MAVVAAAFSALLPCAAIDSPNVPPLSVLNGSYFVAARRAMAGKGTGSAALQSATAAINASAWLHTAEAHVHDTPRTRNSTLLWYFSPVK